MDERVYMKDYVHQNTLVCIKRLLSERFEVKPAIPPFDDPVMEVSSVPSFRNSSFSEGNLLGKGAAGDEFRRRTLEHGSGKRH